MVATEAPAEVFAGLADELRAAAARFEPYPQQHLFLGVHEAATRRRRRRSATTTRAPSTSARCSGSANPLAPPLRLAVERRRGRGHRHASARPTRDPPGCVHGGFVAAAFDELLGLVQMHRRQPGHDRPAHVHYRSPTPLHTELRFEGRSIRVDGRKTFCTGEIYAGDRLCAEAEGLFVVVDLAKIAELAEQANERLATPA